MIATRTTYTWPAYMQLADQLVAEGRTTGPDQSQQMLEYTKLNHQRMSRVSKTMALLSDTTESLGKLQGQYIWQLISEPWCGDAAQIVPAIGIMAEAAPGIDLEIILRDDNLDLMDQHLTNGGRAIPKLLVLDAHTREVLSTWGPRPRPAQDMVVAYKAMAEKPPYNEFVIELQKWYTHDKTHTIQQEIVALMTALES